MKTCHVVSSHHKPWQKPFRKRNNARCVQNASNKPINLFLALAQKVLVRYCLHRGLTEPETAAATLLLRHSASIKQPQT